MLTARDASEMAHDFSRRKKTRREIMRAIQNHIEEVCTRYDSKFHTWYEDATFSLDPTIRYYVVRRLTDAGYRVTVAKGDDESPVCLLIGWE